MKRFEINKKHGMAYAPQTMKEAIEKAGLKPEPRKVFTDAEVAKIEAELKKLPKKDAK